MNELVRDCINKLDKLNNYSWNEIIDKHTIKLSPHELRKRAYGMKMAIESCGEDSISNDKLLEIKKQKVQLSDLRTDVNKQIRSLARTENVIDLLKDEIKNLSNKKPMINHYEFKTEPSGVDGILMFSDWHYSLKINNSINYYDEEICEERLNCIINQAVQLGVKNKIDKLHIICLGDLVSGEIHNTVRLSNQEGIAKQIIQVSELLCECIKELSNYFYCVVTIVQGNHDSVDAKKTDRLNRNNYTDLIKEIINIRFKDTNNVLILDNNINDGEISTLRVKDLAVACCHGDKINKLKAKSELEMATNHKLDLILCGHLHNPQMYSIYDTDIYVNGSLCGTDEYAMNNKLYSIPSQTMLLVNDNGILSSSILKIL